MYYLVRTVDSSIMCPVLCFYHFLVVNDIPAPMLNVLKTMEWWGRQGHHRERRQTHIQSWCQFQAESVFPQGWKGSDVVSLPPGAWLVSLKGSMSASVAGRLSNQHTPGTCFASSEWQTTEARGLQLIKSSDALAYSLVDNKMRPKSLCILCPIPGIHWHLPDFFVSNLLNSHL